MSAPPVEPMFLRPAEAAALACLSTRAIYRAIDRGELRAVRLCSRLRIPREEFEAWIASSTVRVERRVVALRPTAPPPVRGSFRRLFDERRFWLCAGAPRDEGSVDDAYEVFAGLHETGRFLPGADDRLRDELEHNARVIDAAAAAIPDALESALARPGVRRASVNPGGSRTRSVGDRR